MSALPPKADISWTSRHVRYVPEADNISLLIRSRRDQALVASHASADEQGRGSLLVERLTHFEDDDLIAGRVGGLA
jgi:hypothetical protein